MNRFPSRALLPSLLLLPCLLLPFRARAADRAARLAQAAEAFQRALAGDAGAVGRAEALYRELAAEDPSDPVVLACAGSAAAMAGRDARSPLERLRRTEDGLSEVDLALRRLGPAHHDQRQPGRLPARLETLLVAASTYLAVPDAVFHRLGDGKAALAAALSHPAAGQAPPAVRARLEWLSALVARAEGRPGDERAALSRALALDPEGLLSPRARARLAEVAP